MLAWLAAAAAMAAPPAAGRYAGQWCVAVAAGEAACGPAKVEWRAGGRASVGISDIVYTLRLGARQVDVGLKHGAMQIDTFSAIYEWHGSSLYFVDADKNVRYEVHTEAPRKLAPRRANAPLAPRD